MDKTPEEIERMLNIEENHIELKKNVADTYLGLVESFVESEINSTIKGIKHEEIQNMVLTQLRDILKEKAKKAAYAHLYLAIDTLKQEDNNDI